MAVTLDTIAFDSAHTTVREAHQEIGGRRERVIEIAGVITGESTAQAIEARLDAILDAASADDYEAELSVRTGRRLMVRRTEFVRQVSAEALAGSFTLKLHARDPFEESTAATSENWAIAVSGATLALASGGNVFALPRIALTATGNVVNPTFSDGDRVIAYNGIVAGGSVLILDGPESRATLDGEDVTPYVNGLFPRVDPAGTTLTYADDEASSHAADVAVSFRDRWW